MADTDTSSNPFAGMFSFLANDPGGGGALSYPAMEARRKIALQMIANSSKKGYPKTLGEGLTAIGDAIGERGALARLAQQEAAYQKLASATATDAVPGEARPTRTSDAGPIVEPDEDKPVGPVADLASAPPVQPSASTPPDVAADVQQPPIVPPQTAAVVPSVLPPTRALSEPGAGPPTDAERATGLQMLKTAMTGARPAALQSGPLPTDAPPLAGASPTVRDAIARQLTVPGVPQPNPTSAGPTAPATIPSTPMQAGSPPEAAGNRPIMSDIPPAAPVPVPGAQMAQAAPPVPQRLAPAPRIPLPTDVPMSEDEKRGYQLRAKALALGDPYLQQQADGLIKYGADQRKQQYDAILQDYRDQMLERRTRQTAEEAFARTQSTPEHALAVKTAAEELAKVQNENRLRAQFGNLPPAEVFKQVDASRALAKGAQQALVASQTAMDAFNKGAITGTGANQRLDAAKLFTALGLVDKHDVIANTETFRNAMQPVVASILHQTSGTSQLSEGELRFAQKAAAGDITLDPASIRELMRIIDKRSNEVIRDHQTLTGALFGDNPQAKAMYGIEAPPKSQDAQAREWLQANPNDPRAPAIRRRLGIP